MNTTDKKTPPHQPSRERSEVAHPIRAFTNAERKRLWHNSPEHQKDAINRAAFERIVTLTERAHGMLQPVQPGEGQQLTQGGNHG